MKWHLGDSRRNCTLGLAPSALVCIFHDPVPPTFIPSGASGLAHENGLRIRMVAHEIRMFKSAKIYASQNVGSRHGSYKYTKYKIQLALLVQYV